MDNRDIFYTKKVRFKQFSEAQTFFEKFQRKNFGNLPTRNAQTIKIHGDLEIFDLTEPASSFDTVPLSNFRTLCRTAAQNSPPSVAGYFAPGRVGLIVCVSLFNDRIARGQTLGCPQH